MVCEQHRGLIRVATECTGQARGRQSFSAAESGGHGTLTVCVFARKTFGRIVIDAHVEVEILLFVVGIFVHLED